MGAVSDDTRGRIQMEIDRLWPHALGIFESTKYDQVLAASAVTPMEEELCDRWRGEVEPLLESAGFRVPLNATPCYGGRAGEHPPEMISLLADLQKVARLDPGAKW